VEHARTHVRTHTLPDIHAVKHINTSTPPPIIQHHHHHHHREIVPDASVSLSLSFLPFSLSLRHSVLVLIHSIKGISASGSGATWEDAMNQADARPHTQRNCQQMRASRHLGWFAVRPQQGVTDTRAHTQTHTDTRAHTQTSVKTSFPDNHHIISSVPSGRQVKHPHPLKW